MIRLLAGAVMGALFVAAMGLAWYQSRRQADPCLERCGPGTACQLGECRPSAPAVEAPAPTPLPAFATTPPPRIVRHPRRPAAHPDAGVTLAAEDLRVGREGDDLDRGATQLDFANRQGKSELEQSDLDAVFEPRRPAIERCVADAAGDAPIPWHAELAFRVEASGEVRGVRVEAARLLLAHGLTPCVRTLVEPLRFARSGRSTLARYAIDVK